MNRDKISIEKKNNYSVNIRALLKRLEAAISQSRINVRNESISFAQLLESLPNEESKEFDRTAQIVLKASMQLYHQHCAA